MFGHKHAQVAQPVAEMSVGEKEGQEYSRSKSRLGQAAEYKAQDYPQH